MDETPEYVSDDYRALQTINAEVSLHHGPDSGWTINIERNSDEEVFQNIQNLVENVVATDDIRAEYELEGRSEWLIQARYEP